ncbi:MAG: hypothetical protein K8S99_03560 [Planctomycetes bacterium]|nr:hypothetical protein [Planctomycetota bacterium]
MPRLHAPRQTPDRNLPRERDVAIIARVVDLVHARSKGDYLRAAEAHRELEQLGVLVKFPRQREAAR